MSAQRHVIQGIVRTNAGAVVAEAQAIVTRGPDRAIFRAVTDSRGMYAVTIDSATGDYLLYVAASSALRLSTFRKRLTGGLGKDTVFVMDVVLTRLEDPQALQTVRIQEKAPTPTRSDELFSGPGANEVLAGGVAAMFMPSQLGDLNALAATMPGTVAARDGGVSVFGLPSTQNAVTLHGLALPVTALPRDALTRVRYTTGTFDPAIGWFSGAVTNVDMSHDFLYATASGTTSVEGPIGGGAGETAAGTPVTPAVLQQSMGATGFALGERLTFNISAQLSRRTMERPSLLDLRQRSLIGAGVSLDSALRFLDIARSLGVPIGSASTNRQEIASSGSVLLSIGTLAMDRMTFQPRKHVANMTLLLTADGVNRFGVRSIATPSVASQSSRFGSVIQGTLSTFVSPKVIHELRASLGITQRHLRPDIALPMARVLVGSSISSTDDGLVDLEAGGSTSGTEAARNLVAELQSNTRFYLHSSHRFKIAADMRYDASQQVLGVEDNGVFQYPSLAAFAANTPSAYSRIASMPEARGKVLNGYLAVGDYWKLTAPVDLMLGLRAEGNAFMMHPQYNSQIDALFGRRTDYTPNRVHVSPRVGLSWQYNPSGSPNRIVRNGHGNLFSPAMGVLRAGVGEFRSLMGPGLLEDPSIMTGLADGMRAIECVGQSVPQAAWQTYASSAAAVPSSCAGDATLAQYREASSPVQIFSRSFDAPRSWRAQVGWTSFHEALAWSIEASSSRNINQSGVVDLNLVDTPSFVLANERNRPVFVPPSSIVTGTGALTPTAARRVQSIGAVIERRSDLKSNVSQVTATLMPNLQQVTRAPLFASISYTYAQGTASSRGFDGAAFYTPSGSEWHASANVPKHSVLLQASADIRYATVGIFARLASGLRFTPLVGSDINGDGMVNDRAFIFDPASQMGSAVSKGMQELLIQAPSSVRSCLSNQLGRPAAVNSCAGPWTTSINLRIHANTSSLGSLWSRVNASLYVGNVESGLDQMLHGRHLHGWGGQAFPDQTLLQVTSFDAASKAFVYSVNPRFGEPRVQLSVPRVPMLVAAEIKVDLGPSRDLQILDRSLKPGRKGNAGPRRTSAVIKRFYQRMMPDPFAVTLELSDSLLLSLDQMRALTEGQAAYLTRVDSVVTRLSTWLAALPDDYDPRAALQRQESALTEVLNIGREEVRRVFTDVLNKTQLNLLPWPTNLMQRAEKPLTLQEIRRGSP